MLAPMLSQKASRFTESVIRGMSIEARRHGAVNLGQGSPDFSAPAEIKEAAGRAIQADINQYAITWGAKPLGKRLRKTPPGTADWTRPRRDHRDLRLDRSDDVRNDGGDQPWR